jgi:hypothetical protein
MTAPTSARRRAVARRRGDRGASVLEAAVVAPVLLLLVLGVFEFGLVYRDYLSVGDAVGDAAHIGSIQGNAKVPASPAPGAPNVTPDYSMVRTLREGTAGIPPEWIEKIVIFRVGFFERNQPAMDLVPDSCRYGNSSNAGDQCNVYPAFAAFYAVQEGEINYFNCPSDETTGETGTGPRECGWPYSERSDGPVREEIDYVGVYVKLDRDLVTGVFGDEFSIEQAQVLRLEPGQIDDES